VSGSIFDSAADDALVPYGCTECEDADHLTTIPLTARRLRSCPGQSQTTRPRPSRSRLCLCSVWRVR